jgi:hypothetical protein
VNRAQHALAVKAFRAKKPPRMGVVDSAGISTKPWGARRIYGIGMSGGPSGPSRAAMTHWQRSTGVKPTSAPKAMRAIGMRRRTRRPFGL